MGSRNPTDSPITLRGLGTAALNMGRALLVAATVLSFFVLWFFNPQAGRFALVLLPLLALATYARARATLVPWAVYILGFLVFVDLRMISAELWFPARFDYVISLERLLFLGHIPSVVMQQALYQLGRPSALDISLIAVHFSFFLVPHLLAVWLWLFRRELFGRYVGALIMTCWAGLLIAFVIPTAPPWLAAGEERIAHVHRIVRDVLMGANPDTYTAGIRAVGENDAAAMPSLHTALTVLVALAMSRINRVSAAVGWLYAVAMGIALVYLGEHYVVDVLAGVAFAVFFWRLAGRWTPRAVPDSVVAPERASRVHTAPIAEVAGR